MTNEKNKNIAVDVNVDTVLATLCAACKFALHDLEWFCGMSATDRLKSQNALTAALLEVFRLADRTPEDVRAAGNVCGLLLETDPQASPPPDPRKKVQQELEDLVTRIVRKELSDIGISTNTPLPRR